MKLLKHPVRSIREPFGKAGLIVAILALVLGTTGAAFAAKGALTGKQKKEVEKIAKKYAGKPGAAGATGPAGLAGPAGSAGAKGETGGAGNAGTPGAPGVPGKSVTVTSISSGGAKCSGRAGAEVKQEGAASGTEVCEGSPWTAGGAIPSGTLVTGTWNASASGEYGGSPVANISFDPLPVKEGVQNSAFAFKEIQVLEQKFGRLEVFPGFFEACKVEAGEPECIDTGCSGTALNPVVAAKHLCIYATYEFTNTDPELLMASSTGVPGQAVDDYSQFGTAIVPRSGSFSDTAHYNAYGTWALRAP
jgi:hypothetical protein